MQTRIQKQTGDQMKSIKGVYYNQGQGGYGVGHSGVTEIREIQKTGNGAMVAWYQVYKGEDLICELNSTLMESVYYFEKDND